MGNLNIACLWEKNCSTFWKRSMMEVCYLTRGIALVHVFLCKRTEQWVPFLNSVQRHTAVFCWKTLPPFGLFWNCMQGWCAVCWRVSSSLKHAGDVVDEWFGKELHVKRKKRVFLSISGIQIYTFTDSLFLFYFFIYTPSLFQIWFMVIVSWFNAWLQTFNGYWGQSVGHAVGHQ